MGIEYANRRGDVYRLMVGKTKTGKPKYYMAKNKKALGEPADEMPEGYEIYEDPADARVLVRKIKPRRTTEEEQQILEQAIRRHPKAQHLIVKADGDALIVYLSKAAEFSDEEAERFQRVFGPSSIEYFAKHGTYTKMMQFVLRDEERRLFTVDRWCFRGSIDNWWPLGGRGSLSELVENYLPHVGEESFYELM